MHRKKNMGNQENTKQWGYILALALIVLVIAGQISFFSSDYIWWIPYEPLSPLPWDAMSTLTYLTIGSALYFLGFYRALHFVLVRVLRCTRKEYKEIKYGIWIVLMYATYRTQIAVVQGLNFLDSLFWNVIRIIVFLWPSWCIIAGSFIAFFLLKKLRKTKTPHTAP